MRLRLLFSAAVGPFIVTYCNAETPLELVLQPTVHWTVSTTDIWHLQARHDHSLYYAENGHADPDQEHLYGVTAVQYTSPAVNLDHSEHVHIHIEQDKATLSFSDSTAFEHAHAWNTHPKLLFLVHPSACSQPGAKDYCYLSAQNLVYNKASLLVTARIKKVRPDQCIKHAAFHWGVHRPAPVERPVADLTRIDDMAGAGDVLDLSDALKIANSRKSGAGSIPVQPEKRADHNHHSSDLLRWDPKKIPGIHHPVNKQFRKSFSWNLPQNRGTDDSPWGKAKRLGSWKAKAETPSRAAISMYCVDCGSTGSMIVSGKGIWSAKHGLTEGSVSVLSNMDIGFTLGLDMHGNRTSLINIPLGTHGFPCITFGLLAIGPMVSVAADVRIASNGGGNMLTGARVMIANGLTTLDLVHPQKSTSAGWSPEFVPVLESQGNTNLGVEVGLPIGISVGISILEGRYGKTAGVIERPALEAKAQARDSKAALVTTDGCNGISTQINFKNELYADILGAKYGLLHPYSRTLTKGCLSRHTSHVKKPTFPSLQAFNTTEPFANTHAPLLDPTRTLALASCPDGGVHLLPLDSEGFCARTFALDDSAVVADGFTRALVYDGAVMRRVGASPLRAYEANALPIGSQPVTLRKGPQEALVAHNAAGAVFPLVLCTFWHQAPTVFLVQSPTGKKALLAKAGEQIAGGKVRGCWDLPVRPGGQEAQWDNAWGANQGYEGAEEGKWLDRQEWFKK